MYLKRYGLFWIGGGTFRKDFFQCSFLTPFDSCNMQLVRSTKQLVSIFQEKIRVFLKDTLFHYSVNLSS